MQLRMGLVGCGPRQRQHMTALRQVPELKVAACVDIDAQRLQDFGQAYGLGPGQRFRTVGDMLAAEHIDVATVVTSPRVRLEIVQVLAQGGVRAILVEKPMALELEDAYQMLRVCADAGIQLMVNHQYRFLPFVGAIREALASDSLGKIEYVRTTCPMNLHAHAVHMIDLANYLVGDEPLEWVLGNVGGTGAFASKHPGPDSAIATFAYRNGIRLHLECGPQSPRSDDRAKLHLYIEVVGDRGRAWGGIDSGYRIVTGGAAPREMRDLWSTGQTVAQVALFRHIVQTVVDQRADENLCRASLGVRTIEAVIGTMQSALEHRIVSLPPQVPPGYLEQVRRTLTGVSGA